MMGAAGYAEYDYYEDDDDDESVYATEPEEEETSNLTLQVTEWLDKVKPSRIDEQRMVTSKKRKGNSLSKTLLRRAGLMGRRSII